MRCSKFASAAAQAFFAICPKRHYYLEQFTPEEMGLSQLVAAFSSDDKAELAEVRHIVFRRIPGGRLGRYIAIEGDAKFESDDQIVQLLKSRGIHPETLQSIAGQ